MLFMLKNYLSKKQLFQKYNKDLIFPGADPKSVVCAFFKQGQCTKGDKCKFSHDLSIERKAEKRSLYVDMRDSDDPEDTMENWDEDKLKEVIEKKHGKDKKMPTTDIVIHETFKFSMFLLFVYFRYASIFWKLWKNPNMAGSGHVHLEKTVFIGMLFRLDLCLKKIKRKTTRRVTYHWRI